MLKEVIQYTTLSTAGKRCSVGFIAMDMILDFIDVDYGGFSTIRTSKGKPNWFELSGGLQNRG